jgi:molybdopterin molybdotransferase
MQSPGEAARTILEHIERLAIECIPITEALGRVLANDARSPIDLPAWDNSVMDGFAVRSSDAGDGGGGAGEIILRVVETIPAGQFPKAAIGPGECSRIFTGAPVPEGADSVIRQEDTTLLDEGRVRIDDTRDAGKNVRRRGEDIEQGTVVLQQGTPLEPAQLGVLASMAQSEVHVYRAPRVNHLGTGDEIADLDEREAILGGKKVASSNTYTLDALIQRSGAIPAGLGIAKDDPKNIRRRLSGVFAADLVITTGGISVGEHDHMRTVIEQMGADLKFWRIRMRPGAPVGFGLMGSTPWIGLPGNPVSTMVGYELFARPAIRKMMGHSLLFRRTVPVKTAEPLNIPAKLTHFLRAIVQESDGELTARLTGPQGSGILTSMARANALLIVPAERVEIPAGETLQAMLLDEQIHVAEPPFE